MTLPPRGSGRWWNLMFRTALDRAYAQMDYAIAVLKQDGYPPLVKPLTLTALNEMAPDQAARELQMELRRTMKQDEVSGTPVPDDATLKLIRDYMQTQQTRQDYST